ncbi:hypothetical protein ACFL6I_22315 [candidate division KSB1 bacterium]
MERTTPADLVSNIYTLFIQTRKVLFSGKFLYVLGFVVLWEGSALFINHVAADTVIPLTGMFAVFNLVPLIIIALYVSMMLVTFEKDNNTIETMFAIPGSPYKVWSYKLVTQNLLILFITILLALFSFFFIADFSIVLLVVSVYVPVFLIANFNFFLSIVFKNGYAAGLITLIILFLNFILMDVLEHSAWFLYLCPFSKPYDLDIVIWNEKLLYNKASVFSLGILFLYLGLNKLRNREPFIG